MISKATTKYIRISPKKAMLVTRPVKGMSVPNAYALLGSINKKAAKFIKMTLKSAVNNAHKKDQRLNDSDLYILRISADSGPMLKRFRAGTMGRAFMIRKRTCHLTIQLGVKKKRGAEIVPVRKSAKVKSKNAMKLRVAKPAANLVKRQKSR